MRTQVGIVGAGPAGLMLAHLLEREGIESVVLEARDRAYVEARVRAGLLEQNTIDLLDEVGVGERMHREGSPQDGVYLRFRGRTCRIDVDALTGGRKTMIYGQQEIVKDLIASWLGRGGQLHFEVSAVALSGIDGERPAIDFVHDETAVRLDCDFVAGCDGFHGVCRPSIPASSLTITERPLPFGWLGILAEATPQTDELIYAWHEHGFALYSFRSQQVSRLYLQVPADEDPDGWSDDRIWAELQRRFAAEGFAVGEGPILDKGVTAMRSFVCDPMQHGRLFLAGDAAHIVPPTGAKGLNLAMNDVRLLADALARHYRDGDATALETYSERALRRVWLAQDFSEDVIRLLHKLEGGTYEQATQLARLDHLFRSESAQRAFAEVYAGVPPTFEL
ncbi:MAG TPA: 4-hydroxybenzoate 3-monooxygenase [Conexibacter sp.]|nr:4-hydroxybenzoate 3-monooxygenase [Conexibacter sp.]